MAHLLTIQQIKDEKGIVTILDNIEKLLPFSIKRVFFIQALVDINRGGHRHIKTKQALICVHGSCIISVNDGKNKQDFFLDNSGKSLIIDVNDWHLMHSFRPDTILLVFASEVYDPDDYIREPYKEIANDTL